ncbi:Pfs, NB-ARC and ankyrin domain protein [Thelonectria olida]|uniref:Pfs, NB-ARC and ankyrin domain protein n=1 Tax=Thelonectria olida TaxID=1576542 RepID=A0A9P8W3D6_9HYPO|nr:Pfs, NB-ARC and ankyrin domain protein [Thelonectria olida]
MADDDHSPPRKRHRTAIQHDNDSRKPRRRLAHRDYTVAWVCALPIELAAAKAMLDDIHESFSGGQVVASNINRSFTCITIGLMVGIGGGVPTKLDIRLGDVVVSNQVIQYDYGKTVQDGRFHRTSNPVRTPQAIMTAVAQLRAQHEVEPTKMPSFLLNVLACHPFMRPFAFPASAEDGLFQSTFEHDPTVESCDFCDPFMIQSRPPRQMNDPKIHYGVVASSNQVIRHARTRDTAAEADDVLCFEVEAAGLMDHFPCLVIRGICDYSDSHKSKEWQRYAAATAAAYTKELLSVIHKPQIESTCIAEDGKTSKPRCSVLGYLADPIIDEFSHQSKPSPLNGKQREELMDSLRFRQLDSRQLTIRNAHSRTCDWLLRKAEYLDWLDDDKREMHHGFLWVKGKPGAGKSTLMKFILRHAQRTMKNRSVISFFFNARGDDLEKSTLGMYRSLLVQLLEHLPALQCVFDSLRLSDTSSLRQYQWGIEVLRDLFEKAVQSLGDHPILCFIDALDEHLGEFAVSQRVWFHVCFSSRHYPHITMKSVVELVLEGQHGHSQGMTQYINSELQIGQSNLATEIRIELLRKASGVFMWIVLVVELLNKEYDSGRLHALKRRLQEIPEDLHALCHDILAWGDHDKDELLLCIQWTLFARRPLHPRELYFAILSGVTDTWELRDHMEPSTEDMGRFILNSSKGLAETTKSSSPTVQFIHETFSNAPPFKSLLASPEDDFPFLNYAVFNVLYHADKAAEHGASQKEFLRKFSVERWAKLRNYFEENEAHHYAPNTRLRYILAEANASNLIEIDPQGLSCIEMKDERYGCPLLAAVTSRNAEALEAFRRAFVMSLPPDNLIAREYGHGSVSKDHLLQLPAQFSAKNREVVSCFGELGDAGLLALAIEAGNLKCDIKDERGITPLAWAAKGGFEDAIKALLATGRVNPDSRDAHGNTPLLWAARGGYVSVVDLLLQTGRVNPDSRERSSNCSLRQAGLMLMQEIQKAGHRYLGLLTAMAFKSPSCFSIPTLSILCQKTYTAEQHCRTHGAHQ